MITILCNVYEKHDMLNILKYAKEKKIEDCNNDLITPGLLKLELEKIDRLKRRILGQKPAEDYQLQNKNYREKYTVSEDHDDLPKAPFNIV